MRGWCVGRMAGGRCQGYRVEMISCADRAHLPPGSGSRSSLAHPRSWITSATGRRWLFLPLRQVYDTATIEHMFPVGEAVWRTHPGVFACASRWAGPPSASLVRDLATTPPGSGSFGRLERLAAWERVIAWAQGRQLVELAELVDAAAAAPLEMGTPEDAIASCEAETGLVL